MMHPYKVYRLRLISIGQLTSHTQFKYLVNINENAITYTIEASYILVRIFTLKSIPLITLTHLLGLI